MACKTHENRMITTMEKTGELVEYRPVKTGLNQTAGTSLKKKNSCKPIKFQNKNEHKLEKIKAFFSA